MNHKCPKCEQNALRFEDLSKLGFSNKYWSCDNCGEEMIMCKGER